MNRPTKIWLYIENCINRRTVGHTQLMSKCDWIGVLVHVPVAVPVWVITVRKCTQPVRCYVHAGDIYIHAILKIGVPRLLLPHFSILRCCFFISSVRCIHSHRSLCVGLAMKKKTKNKTKKIAYLLNTQWVHCNAFFRSISRMGDHHRPVAH